jgi:hypothetical protein
LRRRGGTERGHCAQKSSDLLVQDGISYGARA